ncbi:MAG: calcium-binding protein [Oscillatoriales cyanobacterium RM2_1_1]|nr:calcium-binding protein [Oscillatoriales cyanobacterium SM2_3_0]NJO47702.1 calcium-binding protein [Oscillatoriales cyanobacterium RM2_1_1]
MDSQTFGFKIPEEIQSLIPAEKLEKVVRSFVKIDDNQDGKIELEEYINHLLEKEREKLTKQFRYLDTDGDGYIEFEEFLAATEPHYPILKKFRKFDRERNGLLTVEEAIKIAEELSLPYSQAQIEQAMQEIDRDGDGQVTYYEYLGAMIHFGFQ